MRYEVKAMRGRRRADALLRWMPLDANDATAQAMAQGYTVIAIKAKQSWPDMAKPRRRISLWCCSARNCWPCWMPA